MLMTFAFFGLSWKNDSRISRFCNRDYWIFGFLFKKVSKGFASRVLEALFQVVAFIC